MADEVQNGVDRQIQELESNKPENEPAEAASENKAIYKLDPNTKIPVSRFEGGVWRGRKDSGKKLLDQLTSMWNEAEAYYSNSQSNHRKDTHGDKDGTRAYAKNRREAYSMTENIVYSTVNAVIPAIYAKNPTIEVTMDDQSMEQFGVLVKRLANRLAEMKSAPGINLKPKMKKSIVRCEITNEAWILVGWTKKEFSADEAREDIARISKALTEAKDGEEIKELEGQLLALEESVDLLDPAGPFVKSLRGEQVIVDSDSQEDDFSDANWIMCWMMLPTNYLNAKYRQENPEGDYVSAYKATHVVDANTEQSADGIQEQINSFKMFSEGEDSPENYNYKDRRTFDRAKRTKVWYCFDKVKRRFYMYADNDWTWPIWTFDDPYHLPNFFPLHRLQYHTDPRATRTKGEVSNYLDQQDEINVIRTEMNRARLIVRDNLLFDSKHIDQKTVEDIMLNANQKFKGIKKPEGMKWEELIGAPPLPTMQFQFLWDDAKAKQGVNTISGVGDALRGEQFKTNTTNKAIEEYSSINGVRLDEKRDAIEDFIAAIMYDVLFLSLQFMEAETVALLVGPGFQQLMSQWRPLEPTEVRKLLMCQVAGGSSQKPTSAAKKAEALQIGQILGQFAQNPAVGIILLKMFSRAFDSIVITNEDWQMLLGQINAQQQGPPPEQQGTQEAGNQQISQMVQQAVARGVPQDQAEQMIREKMASQGKKPAQNQNSNQSVH